MANTGATYPDLNQFTPHLGTGCFVGSPSLAPNLLQLAIVQITAAQLLGMNTTPIVLVPAGSSAKGNGIPQTISIAQILFRYLQGGVAFAGGAALTVQHAGGNALCNSVPATLLTNNTSSDVIRNFIDAVGTPNSAVTLTTATAFTGGTGTMIAYVWYSIV